MWRYCACYMITFVTRLLEKAAISQEQRFSYSNLVIWSLCMGMCQLTNPWPPLPPNRDSKLEPPPSPVKTCVGSCGQTHRPLCRIFRPYVVLPIWQCHRLPVLYQSFRKKAKLAIMAYRRRPVLALSPTWQNCQVCGSLWLLVCVLSVSFLRPIFAQTCNRKMVQLIKRLSQQNNNK